jgi:hypothetical protein
MSARTLRGTARGWARAKLQAMIRHDMLARKHHPLPHQGMLPWLSSILFTRRVNRLPLLATGMASRISFMATRSTSVWAYFSGVEFPSVTQSSHANSANLSNCRITIHSRGCQGMRHTASCPNNFPSSPMSQLVGENRFPFDFLDPRQQFLRDH